MQRMIAGIIVSAITSAAPSHCNNKDTVTAAAEDTAAAVS